MPTSKKLSQNEQFWRDHTSQWQDGGLTQAAYCRQHALCQQKFSYYKHKYSSTTLVPVIRKSSGFVSVQVLPERQTHEPLTLHFTNGVRLSGINDNNVSLVKQLAGMWS
jgi:hypothetical protein